jgi:peroxiredoxin
LTGHFTVIMRLKRLKYIIFLFLGFSLMVSGQHFRIGVEFPAMSGKSVVLAQHYLGNIYTRDTLLLDREGKGVFEADSLLSQGLYKIFHDQDNHFDFLLGADQQFRLKNSAFQSETMQIEGSEEAAAFAAYTRFLKDLKAEDAVLREELDSAGEDERERLKQKKEELTGRLYARWRQIEAAFPGSFLAKFVQANHIPSPDISTFPEEIQKNDTLLSRSLFHYQQKHFWDYFDYTDERFLYTPFYKKRLETWFTQVLIQHYDSIRNPVFRFIDEVKSNERIFQFVLSFFLNNSINSNIMGMDALFVDLAKKYYLSGEAFWATEESLEKIREHVLFAENNLIGQTAPDLTLEGYDGEYYNLHQVEAKYTLVVLYEPGCSHCNTFVPSLYSEVYQPFKDKGLEVYAIYTMSDKEEWGEFLTEHALFDWINVWDEHHVSRFKILYDARKTPGLYILDHEKKIIAKKLPVEQVKSYLEHHLR